MNSLDNGDNEIILSLVILISEQNKIVISNQYKIRKYQTSINNLYTSMTTYAQTTIHSKVAKFQKSSDNSKSLGKVIKGGSFCQPQPQASIKYHNSLLMLDNDLLKQLQILPKNKTTINRKMKNKVIPSLTRGDEIILMESSVFPPIYFKKTSMRNVLKQFIFPLNVRALPPNDDRTPLIFQVIANLFNEITFYIFNILIGENMLTQSYYVFFSDSETIPFTKCCNAPVYVELMNNGSGKVLCNSAGCKNSSLAEFLINFEDGKKLWKDITYFSQASQKDKMLRNKISRFITNGKYKRMSLVDTVQETSKQIVQLFYKSKQNNNNNNKQQQQQVVQEEFDDTPFLTAGKQYVDNAQNLKGLSGQQQQYDGDNNPLQNEVQSNKPFTAQQLLDPNQTDVGILKMKVHYLAKNQRDLHKKLSRQIVRNGKVFQSEFDMIKKIDQIMLKKRNSKAGRVSFPKIIEQYRITKYRQSKSKSFYEKKKQRNNLSVIAG